MRRRTSGEQPISEDWSDDPEDLLHLYLYLNRPPSPSTNGLAENQTSIQFCGTRLSAQSSHITTTQAPPGVSADIHTVSVATQRASNQVVLVGIRGGGRAVRDAELGVDVFDVAGDGVRADDEMLGDLPIRSASRQVGQHLEFTGR